MHLCKPCMPCLLRSRPLIGTGCKHMLARECRSALQHAGCDAHVRWQEYMTRKVLWVELPCFLGSFFECWRMTGAP